MFGYKGLRSTERWSNPILGKVYTYPYNLGYWIPAFAGMTGGLLPY
jgi:hypothetical protein